MGKTSLRHKAENTVELGPVLQQANALPTELRRTLTELRHTLEVHIFPDIYIDHRWQQHAYAYFSVTFRKKIEMALMLQAGAQGKTIHETNQKQKTSWHCPFK